MFVWTSMHEQAFQALKSTLVFAPVLALPNFTKKFAIQTDASATEMQFSLLWEDHPIAFLSRALGPKNQGLSTYEKEYMARLLAITQWQSYLQLAEFIIYTDHRSLTQPNKQRLHTFWQQKVYTTRIGLQYRIVYKKGAKNSAADALSCRTHGQAELLAVSMITAP